jgi:hypothetical protein
MLKMQFGIKAPFAASLLTLRHSKKFMAHPPEDRSRFFYFQRDAIYSFKRVEINPIRIYSLPCQNLFFVTLTSFDGYVNYDNSYQVDMLEEAICHRHRCQSPFERYYLKTAPFAGW